MPVVHEGKLIGILSEYDLRPHLESLDSTVVLEAMTPDPVTVSPAATLEHAVALLKGKEVGALPVVYNGRLDRHHHGQQSMVPRAAPSAELVTPALAAVSRFIECLPLPYWMTCCVGVAAGLGVARICSKTALLAFANWPTAAMILCDISSAASLPTRNTDESSYTSPGSRSE